MQVSVANGRASLGRQTKCVSQWPTSVTQIRHPHLPFYPFCILLPLERGGLESLEYRLISVGACCKYYEMLFVQHQTADAKPSNYISGREERGHIG